MRFLRVLAAAAVAAAACGGEEAGPPVATVDLVAADDFFDPDELTAPVGSVEFIVRNRGEDPHTFVIEGMGFKLRVLDPGAFDSGVVRLEAGEFVFYCDIEGHREAGMQGVLVVEDQVD